MIDKVIFVGVHHKPGFKALDSETKTGQVIDQIAMNVAWDCEKTNLYPTDYRPDSLEGEQYIDEFSRKIDDDALYVGLGVIVCEALRRMDIPNLIMVHHPGYPMRIGKIEEYVQGVIDKINHAVDSDIYPLTT